MGNNPRANNKSKKSQILIEKKGTEKKCEAFPSTEEKFESLQNSENKKFKTAKKIWRKFRSKKIQNLHNPKTIILRF